jgi:hypothetical protein
MVYSNAKKRLVCLGMEAASQGVLEAICWRLRQICGLLVDRKK